MAKLIIVDYDTAITRPETKEAVIDAVVENPELLITVLNANHSMTENESRARLRELQFPFDTVVVNPLPPRIPGLTYKTMFASKLQGTDEHETVLILDSDREAAEMWENSRAVKING